MGMSFFQALMFVTVVVLVFVVAYFMGKSKKDRDA
jgi:hypothetical protein